MDKVKEDRLKKLEELRQSGVNPFRNDFRVEHSTGELSEQFGAMEAEELGEKAKGPFRIAGRLTAKRSFGKATFLDVLDATGKLQVYTKKDTLGDKVYSLVKKLDVGDIVGAVGSLTKTRTGELTIVADEFALLTKNLAPLPEKWHGLKDVELRYRQRYLDMIANPEVRETFFKRSKAIKLIRDFFYNHGYVEVETPVMHSIPGGAAAKPFVTHHNALDLELYMRVAPELYLKRLMVGGMERVFEIGRVFRNEGVSIWHNPEFTLLEFYQAYATFEDLMKLTEELFEHLAIEIAGTTKLMFMGKEIDLKGPYERLTMSDSLIKHGGLSKDDVEDGARLVQKAKEHGAEGDLNAGTALVHLYEKLVEHKLIGPVFVYNFPIEASPLARKNEKDPSKVDRFELIIAGKEFANAFNELNDPVDQLERFENQVKEGGDENPKVVDLDYIHALEVGMPPAAGEGVGIDRLMMLLTGAASIREVIPFPLLKREQT